jgi:NAD(P)-dependent dehydrogenase (short-subunit alcohol dehydrogenase family)
MAETKLDPLALFRLDGRVVLITGASSGLGVRFARVLTAAGARTVLAARRIDRLSALADELEGALAVQCDVTVPSENERLVRAAREHRGRIDVLVNNAGITDGPVKAEEESLEQFNRVVAVDMTSVFHLSHLVAPIMIEQGNGSIINIASIHGLCAASPNHQAGYTAAKGGVINMTRELAVQWARKGIRVNAVAPAYFETEVTAAMFSDARSMTWVRRHTPMGRPGEAHELDGALLFLASDASSYVTGTTLTVDGGWTAR